MTIKEYNKLRNDIFTLAMQNAEIAEKAKDPCSGTVYIVELEQIDGKHGVIVLTRKTQLNDRTISDAGFDPEKTKARFVLTFDKPTRTATL